MRIGSRLSGVDLTAQNNLAQAYNRLNLSSARLATMQRINRGADDPAGLIAVESLRAELAAINAASDSAARAGGVVQTADSALNNVSELLNTIRGNIVAAASSDGYSEAEIAAMQLETDAALEAIDRIGRATSFGGRQLLAGDSLTFSFSPDVSDTATLDMPNVNTAALGGDHGMLADLASGGNASLASGNLADAMDILDAASSEVLEARSRAGAFAKYTLASTNNVLEGMKVNLSSAVSQIADTDVAAERSRQVRELILVQAATAAVRLTGLRHSLISSLFGKE